MVEIEFNPVEFTFVSISKTLTLLKSNKCVCVFVCVPVMTVLAFEQRLKLIIMSR